MQFTKKHKIILIHVIAWVIYIGISTLKNVFAVSNYSFNILAIFLTHLPGVYTFYGTIFITQKFLKKATITRFFLAEVSLLLSYLFLAFLVGYIIWPLISTGHIAAGFDIAGLVASGIWVFMIYSFFGFGYYFANRLVQEERKAKAILEYNFGLEAEKLLLQQERLKSQHAFLKAQINSHFLHNTLNFFYAKSLPYSTELSDGIMTLSEIMRYSLRQVNTIDGMEPLGEELMHLRNVIKINQLRFSNKLQIDFSVHGPTAGISIIPLALITLTENAFKHGDLTDPRHPLEIRLEVSEEHGTLYFKIHNKKKKGPKELSHGIGLDNTRQRLRSFYNNNFTFTVTDTEHFYTTELVLPVRIIETIKS
jgi:two-component system LytT family sensor kinase